MDYKKGIIRRKKKRDRSRCTSSRLPCKPCLPHFLSACLPACLPASLGACRSLFVTSHHIRKLGLALRSLITPWATGRDGAMMKFVLCTYQLQVHSFSSYPSLPHHLDASHHIKSNHMASHSIASTRIASHLIQSSPVQSSPIAFQPIISYHLPSHSREGWGGGITRTKTRKHATLYPIHTMPGEGGPTALASSDAESAVCCTAYREHCILHHLH